MKNNFLPLLFSCCFALSAPVCAETTARALDPHTVDIAGIRLGMGYQETIEAMAAHFGMTVEEVDAKAAKLNNNLLNQKLAQWLSITQGPETLAVNFATRIPLDPNDPIVVDVVTYKLPWTPENEANMAQAALEKYGTNSNAPETYGRLWCAEPRVGAMEICPVLEAHLSLRSTELQLSDHSYDQAVRDYLNSAQAAQPKF